jgi:DNA (cytosine-5)-methyltransferase 1
MASLFAGIGGFEEAATGLGIDLACTVEIDRAARGVLRYHWPHATHLSDIKETSADDILASGFDPEHGIVTGGWPCTDLSRGGARAGMAKQSGTRSALFWELHRLVRDLRPAWLVAENVPGALTSHAGRDWGAAVSELADLGYGVAWRVLDAANFGVAQRRRRVIVVARRAGADGLPAAARAAGGVLDLFDGSSRHHRAGAASGRAAAGRPGPGPALGAEQPGAGVDGAGGNAVLTFQKVRRAASATDDEKWEQREVAATLNTFDNGAVRAVEIILQPGVPPRLLTPLEKERLQGFPDDHTLYRRDEKGVVHRQADSARHRQLGNAVAVPVARWVLARLMEA